MSKVIGWTSTIRRALAAAPPNRPKVSWRAIVPLFTMLLCNGCALICNETHVSTAPSKTQLKEATLFVRSCGATTGFATNVYISRTSIGRLLGSSLIFIADSDHGKAATTSDGAVSIALSWQSDDNLILSYPKGTRIFKSENRAMGVAIQYHEQQETTGSQ